MIQCYQHYCYCSRFFFTLMPLFSVSYLIFTVFQLEFSATYYIIQIFFLAMTLDRSIRSTLVGIRGNSPTSVYVINSHIFNGYTVERLFSAINIMKTKLHYRTSTTTIKGALHHIQNPKRPTATYLKPQKSTRRNLTKRCMILKLA